MSDDKPVFVQLVELLGVAEAVANDQPVIVITIRPDPPNFWPHNIALTKDQAWRLATDLGSILAPVRSLGVRLTTATGCGTRVEVESAKWDSSSGRKGRRPGLRWTCCDTRPPEPVTSAVDERTRIGPPSHYLSFVGPWYWRLVGDVVVGLLLVSVLTWGSGYLCVVPITVFAVPSRHLS